MNGMQAFLRASVASVAALSLVACSDSPAGPRDGPPASSPYAARVAALAASERAAAFSGRKQRGAEDDILRLEREVPGLGGVFISDGDELTVYAPSGVSPGQIGAVMRAFAASSEINPQIRRLIADGRIQTRVARFPFSELVAYQQLLREPIFAIREIGGLDADERLNRVRVSVTSAAARAEVERVIGTLGLPDDLVVITETTPLEAAASLRDKWSPTGGAIQITSTANNGRCTLGFNVTYPNGSAGFITAAHCEGSAYPGSGYRLTSIHQPTVGTSNLIGYVDVNPPWHTGICGAYVRCTEADAMVVAQTVAYQKRVAFTAFRGENSAGGSISVTGWWSNVHSPIYAYAGQAINKTGRTTGWTSGTVASTCEDIVVGHATGAYVVWCSERVTGSRVGEGDSGGPVFIPPPPGQITQPLYPLGIVFAGGPWNAYDGSDGAYYCTTGCELAYSNFQQITSWLGATYAPNPTGGGGGGGGGDECIPEPGVECPL